MSSLQAVLRRIDQNEKYGYLFRNKLKFNFKFQRFIYTSFFVFQKTSLFLLLVSCSTIFSSSTRLTYMLVGIELATLMEPELFFLLDSSSNILILSFKLGNLNDTSGDRELTAPCGVSRLKRGRISVLARR